MLSFSSSSGERSLSYEHHITTASELILFSNNVNGDNSFEGTTVSLTSLVVFLNSLNPLEKTGTITSKEHFMDRDTQSAALQYLLFHSLLG